MGVMREVQAPDGRVWRVRRRWLPRQPWLPVEDAVDRGRPYVWGYGGVDWWVIDTLVVPAVMIVGDVVWFALSIPFGALARLVLGRPWRVQAATIGKPRLTREVYVKGLSASRAAIDELAAEIESGRVLGPGSHPG